MMENHAVIRATAPLVLVLCFGFNMLGRGVADTYIVFLLPLGAEFGWNRGQLASVYSIYLLVAGLAAPLTGIAFDRFGPRAVYTTGMIAMGLGYFLASGLTRLWQFQLCIGLLGGVGVCALGMIPASSLIRRWFRGRMSTAIGIAYAGFGSGILMIVPLTQFLIQAYGWRDAYRFLGATFVVLLPLVWLLPWRGLAAGRTPVGSATIARPALGARAVLREAMRRPQFWALMQVFFFTASAMQTMLVQIVAYLVDTGFTPLEAASAFGVAGFLSVVGVIAAGWLSDRIGHRKTATWSFLLTMSGIVLLLLLSFHRAAWVLAGFVLLFGLAQGARGPIVSSLAAKLFPGAGFATVYGAIFATMSIGSGVGAWASGLLHDATGGYYASFAFSLVSITIAACAFWIGALRR
jgi:MFS family permease